MIGTFGGKPDTSGVYRFLKKMESAGIVTSAWQTGDTGHAKRTYEITAEGRRCLEQWTTTLESYLKAIHNLLAESKAALVRRPDLEGSVHGQ